MANGLRQRPDQRPSDEDTNRRFNEVVENEQARDTEQERFKNEAQREIEELTNPQQSDTQQDTDSQNAPQSVGEKDYQSKFSSPADRATGTTSKVDENAAAAAQKNQPQDARQGEKTPSSSPGNIPYTPGSDKPSVGQRARRFLGRRKKAVFFGGSLGGVILILIGLLFSAFPASIGLNMKEYGTRWATKYIQVGTDDRKKNNYRIKLFGECSNPCPAKKGMPERNIRRLQQLGFTVEGQNTLDNGRIAVTELTFRDRNGQTVSVTPDNFSQTYDNNPKFRSLLQLNTSTLGLLFRSSPFLSHMRAIIPTLDRNEGLSDEEDEEARARANREQLLTTASEISAEVTSSADEGVGEEAEDAAEGAEEAAEEAEEEAEEAAEEATEGVEEAQEAIEENDYVENGEQPDNRPSTGELNNTNVLTDWGNAGSTALEATKGGAKSAAMGWLGILDGACGIYMAMQGLNVATQLMMQYELIAFGFNIAVSVDKIKAGEGTPGLATNIGDHFTRKSVAEGSEGLTFSDAPGATLMLQGRVGDNYPDMGAYTTGPPAVAAIQQVYSSLNTGAVGPTICGTVNSTGGQITMLVIGFGSCLLTAGTGCIAGASGGLISGAIIGAIAEYAVPLLAQAAVGVLAPDVYSNPEGSYAVGNAFVSSMASLGNQAGLASGMPALTHALAAQLHNDTADERTMIAQSNAIVDEEKGLFSDTNPMSIQNQLATQLSPHVSQLSDGLGGVISTVASLTRQGASSFGSTAYAASPLDAGGTIDDYRGDLCANPDYEALDLAVTGTCAPIRGPNPNTLCGDRGPDCRYSFQNVFERMEDGGYIDVEVNDETNEVEYPSEFLGEADGDFEDFVETCINEPEPITEHDNTECVETGEPYRDYWVYIQHRHADIGIDESMEGTLGLEGGGATADTQNAPGNSQELAQQILDIADEGGNITIQENPRGTLEEVAAGQPATAHGGEGSTEVSATLLQLILDISQADIGLTITSLTTGGHATNSLHYSGQAVDLGTGNAAQIMDFVFERRTEYDINELFYNPESDKTIVDGNPSPGTTIEEHFDHMHIGVD